jgi:PAS domain S-box-containing protein
MLINEHMEGEKSIGIKPDVVKTRPTRVLHVDDDLGFLQVSKELLELNGPFEVYNTSSVEESFEKIRQEDYAAIVSDYQMPHKDGLDFLKELREKGNDIPFVLFTGKGREEVAIKAINLGADGYVNKQGSIETVYGELSHLLCLSVERSQSKLKMAADALAFQNVEAAIITSNYTQIITSWNKAAEAVFGWSTSESVGKKLEDLFVSLQIDVSFKEVVCALEEKRRFFSKVTFKDKNGQLKYGELTVIAQVNNCGKNVGSTIVYQDLTEHKQMQNSLLKSQAMLNETEKTGKIGGWEFDVNTLTQTWTDETFRILEFDLTQSTPKVPQGIEFINPKYRSMANEAIQRAIKYGEPYDQEWEVTTKKGNRRWVHTVAKANWENGKIKSLSGAFQDITERKKAEIAQHEAKGYAEKLFQTTNAICVILDVKGNVQSTNASTTEITGYTQKELKGRNWFETVVPKNRYPEVWCEFNHLLTGGTPKSFENPILTKSGEERYVVWRNTEIRTQGQIVGTLSFGIDITEHKKAEMAMTKSQEMIRRGREQLEAVILNAPIGIATTTLNYNILSANKLFCEIVGYSEDELKQMTFKDLTHPDDYKESESNMAMLESGAAPFVSLVRRYIRKDGAVRIGKVIVSSVRDEKSKPFSYVAELEDITEYKHSEENLRQSEEKYRGLFESTLDGVVFSNANGLVMSINQAAVIMLGYKNAEELVNTSAETYYQDPEARRVLFELLAKKEKVTDYEVQLKRKDGTPIDVRMTVSLKKDSHGNVLQTEAIFRNVTERKKASKELKRSEQKYRELIDSLPEIIFEADDTGKVIFTNQKGLEFLGYSFDELKQMNIFQFLVPENSQRIKEACQRRTNCKIFPSKEYTILKKDGSTFAALVNIKQVINPDSKSVIRGIIVDLTETKNNTRNLIDLNEKLHVVGSLVRHDVRNKLSAIESNLYLARTKLSAESNALRYIDRIESTINQITEIFNFTSAYERIGHEKLIYIDIENAFMDAVTLLSDPKSVKISCDCHGVSVLADSFLKQLFFNLIENSLKHGKHITQIKINSQIENNRTLKLVYEDDGVGIPYANKPKLFDEGYSSSGGTGYGLYLIKKMMEVYGWTIQETGEPNKGAKFTIRIPEKNIDKENSYILAEGRL